MSNSEPSFTKHSFVTYELNGSVTLAVVTSENTAPGPKKGEQKIKVINEKGSSLELAKDRLNALKSSDAQAIARFKNSRPEEQVSLINQIKAAALKRAESVEIHDIWEFTITQPREYTDYELAEIYFSTIELAEELALRCKLLSEKIYFKRVRNCFEPRPLEVVEQLKLQFEIENKKQQQREQLIGFFSEQLKKAAAGKNYKPELPAEIIPYIKLLENLAAHGDNLAAHEMQEAKKILALLGDELNLKESADLRETAFQLLFRIGYFTLDTNLSIIRFKPHETYSNAAMDEIKKIQGRHSEKIAGLPANTLVEVFSVDDESTRDIDDAFSIQKDCNGSLNLGIHIANVSEFFQSGFPFLNEILDKSTSIYLPDQTYHMLPRELSESALSLIPDQPRYALSLFFKIAVDEHGAPAEIQFDGIKETQVINRKKLSYHEVDELLLKGDEQFKLLLAIATKLENIRQNSGALKIDKQEVEVIREDNGKLSLVNSEEKTPSRFLVSELMVLYNAEAARFCAENNIPCIFRTQEDPEPQEAEVVLPPEGPALDFHKRTQLKRSIAQTVPTKHATLGLKHYSQLSSPIRRSLDLIMQQQLVNFIRNGSVLYSTEDLNKFIETTEQPLNNANLLTRESKRFWILRYLEQRAKKNQLIEGTIVRADGRHPLVELEEVFITVPIFPAVRQPGGNNGEVFDLKKLKAGDHVKLRIIRVIARSEYLKLEVVV